MRKIIIIQTAFLGDVILATPVLAELKRIYPTAEIDFLVKKGNESLLANNPNLNTIYILDKSNGKIKSIKNLIQRFRKENYDLVINLHRFGSSGLIAAFSGAKKKYGFKKNPFSFMYTKKFNHNLNLNQHEVERNLSLIQEFGALKIRRPELYPSEEDTNFVERFISTPYYCFAPASIWFTKQLPIDKWVELINFYNQKGTVYLLGGANDKEFCEEIINKTITKSSKNLAGELSLMKSAALMAKAENNFVNDSGPLHIASAMNAPVTAFFCSTVTTFGFGPLSDNSVVKETNEKLACRPCGLHGHKICPEGHFKCGNSIELDLEKG